MKKIKLSVFFVLISIFASSCASTSVTCEGNLLQDDINYFINAKGNFDEDILTEQKIELRIDLTNYLKYTSIDTLYNNFKEEYLKFNEYDGVIVNVEKNGNFIIIKMEFNLATVDKEIYEKLDIENGKITYKDFIKEFTGIGITCK